jgi:nucleotide-binding universal stress UspA family protein
MSDGPRDRSPVIVGVDGSERSTDALALADLIGPALGRPVVIVHVHPYGQLSSVFSEAEYDTVVREVAESTFDQVREHLPSVPERHMELISDKSPAAGLQAVAERQGGAVVVIGSSHRSAIGRTLIGGPVSGCSPGRPHPSQSPRPAMRPQRSASTSWGAASTVRRSLTGLFLGRPTLRGPRQPACRCSASSSPHSPRRWR